MKLRQVSYERFLPGSLLNLQLCSIGFVKEFGALEKWRSVWTCCLCRRGGINTYRDHDRVYICICGLDQEGCASDSHNCGRDALHDDDGRGMMRWNEDLAVGTRVRSVEGGQN